MSQAGHPSLRGGAAAGADAPPLLPARRRLVLAACLMATFMAAVESTIVATAMPTIVAHLGGFGLYPWVFSAYLLTQAVSIPIYGRLADIYGRKTVFYFGTGLFLIGSVLSGFAPGMLWLVLFRAMQGFGAGGVQPIAMTICGDMYAPAERAKVQGLISSVFGAAAVVGPSLGAFLVEHAAWPVVFWVNVPIGVAAIVMISTFLQENVQVRRHRIDYVGSLLMIVGIGVAVTMLIQGSTLSRGAMVVLGAASAVALVALGVHEAKTPEPMLAVELFRDRVIMIGSVCGGLASAVMMGVSAFLPTYVQGAMGRSAMTAGLVLGAMSITWALSSIFGGRLMVRTSYRLAAQLGALSLMAGSLMLLGLTPSRGVAWAIAASLTIGIGMGLCNTAFIVSIQAAVPWNKRGAATSCCLFLRFIGQALGAASFGSLLNATIKRHGPDTAHMIDQLMTPVSRGLLAPSDRADLIGLIASGLHNAYWLAFVLSAATFVLVWFLPARLSPARQPLR